MTRPIVLASASPRRRELLAGIGVDFLVRPVEFDEAVLDAESPRPYTRRVATGKARAADPRDPGGGADLVVLAADTTVALDGWIPGKPGSRERAIAMLSRLSGRTHQVFTAVVVRKHRHLWSRLVTTAVRFRTLSRDEIEAYAAGGESLDRAGGYAIQGGGGAFVDRIVGSYTNVVGLPLRETLELLQAAR
ncbi:MAG: septum formation inhibitor Maf [Myxococcales bacterium]|nr:septum formation inhibitor Maf [Myxococcales bacterium]